MAALGAALGVECGHRKALQEEVYVASRRHARLASRWMCLHVRARLRLGARAPGAERSGAPGNVGRGRSQLRPRGAVDHAEGQPARVRHQRDAALARHRRPLLVRLPDSRRPPLLHGRSRQEGEDSALRSREDGGRADHDYAHSLRCAEPAVQHRAVRQEGHGVRVQLPGAGDRGHPLDQAARDHDRAVAAGRDQGRWRRRRRERRPAAAGRPDADRPARRAWRTRGRCPGAAAE